VAYLIAEYNNVKQDAEDFPTSIKWSETLKRRKHAGQKEQLNSKFVRQAAYRPFHNIFLYQSPLFIDRPGLADMLFPPSKENQAICFSDINSRTNYCVLVVDGLADLHFGAAVDGYQQVPRFRFVDGAREDNITNWALGQFRAHYTGKAFSERPITKDAIFHYVYAVLYDPLYRKKYALNLKREFPRIPFYADFWQWTAWGEALTRLHLGYAASAPWPLQRTDTPDQKARKARLTPKVILKANEDAGTIQLDSETTIAGVPATAWTYRLGNRSALEWILDQHRETVPKDPTIRAKFNNYRFADHKDAVIDLLKRKHHRLPIPETFRLRSSSSANGIPLKDAALPSSAA
jgi:predicted helicase